MRPSSLFEGVAQRLCILLQLHGSADRPSLFTGGYRRWTTDERPTLLANTDFVSGAWSGEDGPILKASARVELDVFESISGPSLENLVDESNDAIFVHRISRYFVKAIDFVPHFRDANGDIAKSEDYKTFRFVHSYRACILALLNSTLFYWFWRSTGDGFHCGYGDVYRMPLKSESRCG